MGSLSRQIPEFRAVDLLNMGRGQRIANVYYLDRPLGLLPRRSRRWTSRTSGTVGARCSRPPLHTHRAQGARRRAALSSRYSLAGRKRDGVLRLLAGTRIRFMTPLLSVLAGDADVEAQLRAMPRVAVALAGASADAGWISAAANAGDGCRGPETRSPADRAVAPGLEGTIGWTRG